MTKRTFSRTVFIRPSVWVGLVCALGCMVIAGLVVVAARPRIRAQIAMRRAWFNHSLRHYDDALRDLHSARNSARDQMMGDPEWRRLMLEILRGRKDRREIGSTALELSRKGVADDEWLWSGWQSLLAIGDDAAATPLFKALREPKVLVRLPSDRREFLQAYGRHLAGEEEKALESIARVRERRGSGGTAGKKGADAALAACLRAQWLLERGDWKSAEAALDQAALDQAGAKEDLPPRARLCLAAILLTRGRPIMAWGTLDLFLADQGEGAPEVDNFLDRIAATASPPSDAWASRTLSLWRAERRLHDQLFATPPVWPGDRGYPALPAGEIVARVSQDDLYDGYGNKESSRELFRYPSYARLNLQREGTYALVVRAAANRFDHKGGVLCLFIPNRLNAATYFSSRNAADRRLTVNLPAGPTTMTLDGNPFLGHDSLKNRLWLDELILVRRSGAPPPEEEGHKDFLFLDEESAK